MKHYSVEKIEVCTSCNGKGKVPRPPKHLSDDSYELIPCKTCLGSGRLIVKITTEVTPFVVQ